jgi:carbon starvation protein
MLAGIALILASVVLVKMKRERYVWVTLLPSAWLLVCTLTAGWQKVFHDDPRIGFLAHAERFSNAIEKGQVLAPAKTMETMERIVFNDYLDASLAMIFMLVVVAVLAFGVRVALQAWRNTHPTARETPYEPLPAAA